MSLHFVFPCNVAVLCNLSQPWNTNHFIMPQKVSCRLQKSSSKLLSLNYYGDYELTTRCYLLLACIVGINNFNFQSYSQLLRGTRLDKV